MSKRYWLSRPDKNNISYFTEQIKTGQLRQGWGYEKSQDLRLIKKVIEEKGWKDLNAYQNDAIPNLIMLVGDKNAMQIGDVVIVPNTPKWGFFFIIELTGNYQFNIDPEKGDFGHIISCKLICSKNGINKYNKKVPAVFRTGAILDWRKRNRCLDDYSEEIEKLLSIIQSGDNMTHSHSIKERSDQVWEDTKNKLREKMRKSLGQQFSNEEWEFLLQDVLNKFYRGFNVQHTGGRNEHGADLLIELNNVFDNDLPWRVPIQVKHHIGPESDEVLKQLEDAYNYYNQGGIVISIVLLTTATTTTDFREKANTLSNKIGIKILINDSDKIIDLICEGLILS